MKKGIKIGQIFELKKELKYFTLGKSYKIQDVKYEHGIGEEVVTFIDDNNNKHEIINVH